jgi:uncharacterized protein YndB with AHSA1/START domain
MNDESGSTYETIISTPSDTEIRIERVFDATPELLWECHSDPELLSRWLGPNRLKMTVEQFDFRVGGSYRYVHSDDEGNEYVFFGEFLEIEPVESMTWTFNFVMDPQPPPSIDRIRFEPAADGVTKMVSVSEFESMAMRDGMIQSGMEKGVVEGHHRLDTLLVETHG